MKTRKEEKVIPQLPARERCFVKRITPAGHVFYTTGKQDRSQYSLYLEVENGYLLIAKAVEPIGFDDIALDWGKSQTQKRKKAAKVAQSS